MNHLKRKVNTTYRVYYAFYLPTYFGSITLPNAQRQEVHESSIYIFIMATFC
eukprot:XP_001705826.1 Hypothetical protein GL50803_5321 [Giardia lamblia ATCC 50803]